MHLFILHLNVLNAKKSEWIHTSSEFIKVRRYQKGSLKSQIEEIQTTQWQNKRQTDKQWATKHYRQRKLMIDQHVPYKKTDKQFLLSLVETVMLEIFYYFFNNNIRLQSALLAELLFNINLYRIVVVIVPQLFINHCMVLLTFFVWLLYCVIFFYLLLLYLLPYW